MRVRGSREGGKKNEMMGRRGERKKRKENEVKKKGKQRRRGGGGGKAEKRRGRRRRGGRKGEGSAGSKKIYLAQKIYLTQLPFHFLQQPIRCLYEAYGKGINQLTNLLTFSAPAVSINCNQFAAMQEE